MPQPYDYTINAPNLVQSGLQGYQQGLGLQQSQQAILEQQRQREMQEQQRQNAMQMQMDLSNLAEKENKTADDYINIMTKYPDISKDLSVTMGRFNEQQRANMANTASQVYSAINTGNTDYAKQILNKQIEAHRNSGETQTADSLEALSQAIDINPGSAETGIGLTLAGLMGPDIFERFLTTQSTIRQASNRPVRSETLPDGTTIIVGAKGDVTVKNAANEVLRGEDAKKAIKDAQEYGVDIEEMKRAATTEAGEGVKTGIKYAEKLDKVSEYMNTLDEAINIVDKGIADGKDLGVGPIRRYFPSISKTAKELNNVGRRLGLGVIQSATFGALSEAELKMALETAMPKSLSGKNLLSWLQNRKNAQEKLANYLEEAVTFIGAPKEDGMGVNSVRDWVTLQKERKKQNTQQPTQTATMSEQIPNITTQEQFNALPSGAIYYEDGKKYRKP